VSERGPLELYVGSPQRRDGGVSAEVVAGGHPTTLWFRSEDGPLAEDSDAFLPAVLAPAMSRGWTVRFADAISDEVRIGADRVQDILSVWGPGLTKVPLECETGAAELDHDDRGVGCFFSGGVDSFYSVLKHRQEITSLILVHGFDIRLGDVEPRRGISKYLREAAEDLGKTLIEVETNLRAFSRHFVSWEHVYHGSALAAVALALSPLLKKVYISSSHRYDFLIPWGSHPLLDPNWSTPSVTIVHDGNEASRTQKTEAIASNEVVRRSLRVCTFNRESPYNCGRCKKCVRTMVTLSATGALDKFTTFERPLDPSVVRRMRFDRSAARATWRTNFGQLKTTGRDPKLTRAVRSALVRDATLWQPWRFIRDRMKPLYRRMPASVRDAADRAVGRTPRPPHGARF
jgi:hypothetical protein